MNDNEREKQEAQSRAKARYEHRENLDKTEIEELVGYDFQKGAVTVEEQVRRYYLMIKNIDPRDAERMQTLVKPILERGVPDEQGIHDLSVVIDRFMSGFDISIEPTADMKLEMEQKFPLPLKTITSKADKPYSVWQSGSRTVQWKAWRQGRPMIVGYGMTEQDAIEELRYFVSPDHDGTLDGLGKPHQPIIGGNVFRRHEVILYNKSRFCT